MTDTFIQTMPDTFLQTWSKDQSETAESYQFVALLRCVLTTHPVFVEDATPTERTGEPTYSSCRAWGFFVGSWEYVAARVAEEASTSSHGTPVRSLKGDPHPKPLAAKRVRRLKRESGLTWDQLRRLFGVSERSLHLWASGARMNARNAERLTYLEQVIHALGARDADHCREALVSSPSGRGRSIFQSLTMTAGRSAPVDIEALSESSGAGFTVHGDFLFAEEVDDGKGDR